MTDEQLQTLVVWADAADAFRDHQWQPCPECQALDGSELCPVGERLIEARSLAAVRAQKVVRDLQIERAGRCEHPNT